MLSHLKTHTHRHTLIDMNEFLMRKLLKDDFSIEAVVSVSAQHQENPNHSQSVELLLSKSKKSVKNAIGIFLEVLS